MTAIIWTIITIGCAFLAYTGALDLAFMPFVLIFAAYKFFRSAEEVEDRWMVVKVLGMVVCAMAAILVTVYVFTQR